MRRRSLRLVAGLAVATALVGGCSSKHEANDTLPSASETSASPSLEPLGPADLPMPAGARKQSAAGAEAFIRYYFDILNRSLTDLDPRYIRQFADSCEDCERIAQETEQDAAAGYSYKGGELVIAGKISVAIQSPGRAESAFIVDQAALTILDANGQPVPNLTFEAKPGLSSGTLALWDDSTSSWKMSVLTLG